MSELYNMWSELHLSSAVKKYYKIAKVSKINETGDQLQYKVSHTNLFAFGILAETVVIS